MDKQFDMDQLFSVAKNEPCQYSFEETKAQFLNALQANSIPTSSKRIVTLKKWMMLLTGLTVLITICGVFFFGPSDEQVQNASQVTIEQQLKLVQQDETEIGEEHSLNRKSGFVFPALGDLFQGENGEQQAIVSRDTILQSDNEAKSSSEMSPPFMLDQYEFPQLTEEEIRITQRKKKEMLKALAKTDKNTYSFCPSGAFEYNGQHVTTQAFFISRTEVSNFEYRTFLFDLLIQGRKEEFLIAKPDQKQWQIPSFVDTYFSHPAFNDFPMVNISREGAELYCKWLTDEFLRFSEEKKKGRISPIRIPLRVEWVKAASNLGEQLPYAWDGSAMFDSKGKMHANFKQEEEVEDGRANTDITASVRSFSLNALGLYNMCGNVAEMVYEEVNKTGLGTAGGSWQSTAEEIQINAPDPHRGEAGPKPTIGFRIVFSYLSN